MWLAGRWRGLSFRKSSLNTLNSSSSTRCANKPTRAAHMGHGRDTSMVPGEEPGTCPRLLDSWSLEMGATAISTGPVWGWHDSPGVGRVATAPPGGRFPPGESWMILRSHRFRRTTPRGSRCIGQKKYFNNTKQEQKTYLEIAQSLHLTCDNYRYI